MKRIFIILSQKWPEYLLEILVITIGILGAFMLNGWKESRDQRLEEISILENLKSEFSNNLIHFDSIFKKQTIRNKCIHSLLNEKPSDIGLERLDLLMDSVSWSWTFDPSMGSYNSLILSGNLSLISNANLRNNLAGHGDALKDYIEEEQMAGQNTRAFLEEFMIKSYLIKPIGVTRDVDRHPELYKELLEVTVSREYINILNLLNSYIAGIMIEGPLLRDNFIQIIELIDIELSKFNQ